MIVFVAIFFIDPVARAFFDVTDGITEFIGGRDAINGRAFGWNEFRFWRNR